MRFAKECFGEFLGTFILVFIGCGTVALDVVYGTFNSLAIVALLWGVGVALAIFLTRSYSSSHLNPAVSIAMVITLDLPLRKLFPYIAFQFIGAYFAGSLLLFIFNDALLAFESKQGLFRGELGSHQSAVMFGEYFQNQTFSNKISHFEAYLAEAFGTFLLLAAIYLIAKNKRLHRHTQPLFIGAALSLIIYFIAPYTQAGLNPARDFGPRLVAYFGGWGTFAFPPIPFSFFTVYILAPITGAGVAAVSTLLLQNYSLIKLVKSKNGDF